jgi:hypothetical protein
MRLCSGGCPNTGQRGKRVQRAGRRQRLHAAVRSLTFSVAGDLRLRLDETGLGRSNHEAAVTAVGVVSASAGASHDRLCRCAACSCQAGRHPLGLGLKRREMKKRPPQPWTSEDEARLRALAAAGRSAVTIAERLKRPASAVRYKAHRLDIALRRFGHGGKAKWK